MQYILSEEEFKDLKATQKFAIDMNKKKLQELCTKICDEMPIGNNWSKETEPWGCIHSTSTEWMCDNSPVQEICPSEKEWSK